VIPVKIGAGSQLRRLGERLQVVSFLVSGDGVRLKYELVGDGPPLLLHLGAGCDSELWQAAGLLEPLARDYRCILFDHRGHGQSDRPVGKAAYHIDRFAADVVTLLDHLGLERVAVWAYSNAIAVALKLAEQDPNRLIRLIGSGVIGQATSEAELATRVSAAVAEYREYGWEKLIAGFAEDEGEAPVWMQERIRATDLEPVIGWSEARLDWNWSAWEALGRVAAPTLFLVGELEDPDDTMLEAARRMPEGRRVRIPGKGHINGFLDHQFVLPHVQAFLAYTNAD
jgi:pimeloyl-ACP methyl ester carboxylesterase